MAKFFMHARDAADIRTTESRVLKSGRWDMSAAGWAGGALDLERRVALSIWNGWCSRSGTAGMGCREMLGAGAPRSGTAGGGEGWETSSGDDSAGGREE